LLQALLQLFILLHGLLQLRALLHVRVEPADVLVPEAPKDLLRDNLAVHLGGQHLDDLGILAKRKQEPLDPGDGISSPTAYVYRQ